MTEGTVVIIRGQVTGDLVVEQHDLDGEAEALILHLDRAAPVAGFRKVSPVDGVMNIRSGPGTLNSITGKLTGATEAIEEKILDQDNIWVRIGFRQYVARIYKGTVYCVYDG